MSRFETIAVYIMTDGRYGSLYTGVTAHLVKRVSQHRAGEGGRFTSNYNCKRLVWYEVHESMRTAIQREKSIKRYMREWKIKLIEERNPDWNDLWEEIVPRPLPGERRTIEQVRRGEFPDSEE